MKNNTKVMQQVKNVLKTFGNKYITSSDDIVKSKVIEDLNHYDHDLITALLSNKFLHDQYTETIAGTDFFKLNQFVEMFKYKKFWADSFTKYSKKIGLAVDDKFIEDSGDVVLDFPYKDTVLKAGMSREEAGSNFGANEPFLNETIAHAEITELFESKVIINAKQYDKEGEHEATKFNDQDNLIIKGNNLIALHSIAKKYAGKVKLIYLDPPYNTGSDSFAYNDRFNQAAWLTFMKNRLEIAKNLLSEDGHIVIQTDDNEQAYLKVLMDSIFGKDNYVNTVSVLFKNIAGASGGGEDKRLKKNIEYLTIYAKNYATSQPFNDVYDFKEVGKLVQQMRQDGVSWKYTSVLVDPGNAEYIGSTKDSKGNDIKLYKRNGFKIKSISKLMKEENISEEKAYEKYGSKVFQTAMPQSSIRPRVIKEFNKVEHNDNDLMSIRYVPQSGKHKGQEYEQFYKGKNFRLLAWLKDVSVEKDGKLYKKEKQGTFWNFVGATKNVNKEGHVSLPNGKKPEALLERIIKMTTNPKDLILDMFLGSGSTAAAALKLKRQFIGIEQIDYQIQLIKKRLSNVINGDPSGISKDVNWQGGGAFIYTELMKKNQIFIDELNQATNEDDLDKVYQHMKKLADLDFRTDLDKYDKKWGHRKLGFDKHKKLLIELLDKNQLYFNEANIDDADVRTLISDTDYQFNKSFYGKESD